MVDFPLEPVTPIACAGQAFRNSPISVSMAAPGAAGDFNQRISRPHRRIDHQQFGQGEVLLAMFAEVKCGDGRVSQCGQRIGERHFIGRVGDGDDRALLGQPTGRGNSAAKVPQAHDRRPPSAIVHPLNRTLGARVSKACWSPVQTAVL